MALTDENVGGIPATMLVGPTGYGNNNGGFGNDGWWVILLLLALGGGWGNGFGGGFGGGYGNMMLGYDFPWLLNGQQGINNNVSSGFRDAQLSDSITSVRDGISALATQLCGCCGDMQNAMCNGFNSVNMNINSAQAAISQQMYANEIASLERSYNAQTASMQGFTGVNTGIADLRYTVATEACADRQAVNDALRDVIAANTASTQRILDQLCADRIEQKNDTIAQLRSELMYARSQASQDVQTATLRAGQVAEVDALYDRLSQCPISTVPVYGRQPIFSCGCGNPMNSCGCGG